MFFQIYIKTFIVIALLCLVENNHIIPDVLPTYINHFLRLYLCAPLVYAIICDSNLSISLYFRELLNWRGGLLYSVPFVFCLYGLMFLSFVVHDDSSSSFTVMSKVVVVFGGMYSIGMCLLMKKKFSVDVKKISAISYFLVCLALGFYLFIIRHLREIDFGDVYLNLIPALAIAVVYVFTQVVFALAIRANVIKGGSHENIAT